MSWYDDHEPGEVLWAMLFFFMFVIIIAAICIIGLLKI